MQGDVIMRVLVTPTSLQPDKHSPALLKLREFCDDLVFNPTGKPLDENALIELLQDCDGYLAGLDHVSDYVLKRCPKLKAISRYGAGYDRVDVKTAKEQGVKVANTPGANAQAVAELSFAMLMSLARKITYLHQETISGKWVRSTGIELFGKTLGVIGLGAIGKKVAACAKGFNMQVLAYDPYIDEDYCKENGILSADFNTVIKNADFISLHLPLTESTWHLINSDVIAAMKPTAIVVNASRGGIVDEAAAYQALVSNRLGGLGLDAFEHEPPEASPLFSLPNVIATPHAGAHTSEATAAMADMAVENLICMLQGKACEYVVNQ